ncbi:hypothetical protein DFH09DRAFT_1067509 [Mycena vulgaris]|nr:hypothetical protein DFH09DRAFT_1067509 [Mycena vulgaris]
MTQVHFDLSMGHAEIKMGPRHGKEQERESADDTPTLYIFPSPRTALHLVDTAYPLLTPGTPCRTWPAYGGDFTGGTDVDMSGRGKPRSSSVSGSGILRKGTQAYLWQAWQMSNAERERPQCHGQMRQHEGESDTERGKAPQEQHSGPLHTAHRVEQQITVLHALGCGMGKPVRARHGAPHQSQAVHACIIPETVWSAKGDTC